MSSLWNQNHSISAIAPRNSPRCSLDFCLSWTGVLNSPIAQALGIRLSALSSASSGVSERTPRRPFFFHPTISSTIYSQ